MSKGFSLLTDPNGLGSSNSSISYNELLLSQSVAPASAPASTETPLAPASEPSAVAGTTASTTTIAPSAPLSSSVASTPTTAPTQPTTSPATSVVALEVPASEPSLPFDGLLVGWNPLSTAEERANARVALGLGLKETIQTRAMQASGAGPIEWVTLPPGLSAEQAMATLAKRPGVTYAEKNWLLQTQATSNDPGVTNGSLWGMYGDGSSPANAFGSQAAEAWTRGFTGSGDVFVGIIDEGYQYNHSDLIGNAGVNPGETANNGIDDDGNGYVDDVYGWDFVGNNSTVYDGTGDDHGTHVAGTIGGQGGNGIGVAGVNWDVSLLSGKFLGASGGSTANAIKAVDYFTDLKTRHDLNLVATNNSWGGGGFSQSLYDAIARAGNAGILFVAAAGNSNTSTLSYPAGYNLDNVISVASIDSNGVRSSFSNYGSTWVDLGAPGGNIYSTLPDNTYGTYSGTSMAAPHVTGALALMKAAYPTATMLQLRQALFESIVKYASLSTITSTGGRLNVEGALTRLSQLVDPNAPTYAVSAPASVNEGASLSFSLSTTNVAANTPLYWRISGTGISLADFVGLASLQGSLVVDGGSAVLQTNVAADGLSEGNETLLFDVFSDAALTTRVTGTSVLINDTSDGALWGTTGNNTISGSGSPDRLAGVLSTGTTATAMGAGQIDTLTGLGDSDVFLLGDGRGVFYDDRNSRNLGAGDYAQITDFVSGVDKLQVRAGTSYVYTVAGNTLSLYWDRNGNGQLNSSGSNMDELIAVLQGVTSLTSADLIGV